MRDTNVDGYVPRAGGSKLSERSAPDHNWSPDSATVAYCTDDVTPPAKNDSEIDVIDVATRKITRLITGGINPYPA